MNKYLIAIILFLSILNLQAQKKVNLTEKLKDYHIAMEDVSGQELDTKRVKFYLNDGTVIKKRYLSRYDNPDRYDKLIYLDEDNQIRAYVFSKIEEDYVAPENNVFLSNKTKAFPFDVVDINGNSYSLSRLKGKVIVMNFWFTACGPCVKEIPELNKLVDKYRGKDVVFLGFTYNIAYNIKRFLQKFDYKYQLIPESQVEIINYEIKSFPTNIIIDQKAYIVFKTEGYGYNTVDDLDKAISELLKK